MKTTNNGKQADNCKNIETKKATRRAASKNTAEVDALRKLATAMIGTTLQWPNGTQYRLASFEKVTKNKVTFWLSEPPCHHGVSVMDISRTMLEHLQATGEHRTDCGTTVTVNREAEKPLAYIAYCRGVAQDIFTDWGKAVADLSRHVYNTLRDCCGGEVSKESESRYQVYFKEADEWEVCEVSPIDLNRPQDREAYKAQCERLGLPALENSGEITEANALQEASEITDPEGREFRDFTTWNGKTVKAEERQKWTKFFAEGISNKVNFGGNGSTYKHNAGKIRVSIAYRNGSKRAEDMSYCVSWYEETDKGTKLRECENGVSIWQAARAMADFHLLADVVGFTSIDEILNPTEKPSLETSSEITDGAKKESFGKMFIYRLYIKWKWMQQRFERIGDMDHAADCFYHRLRLTKLYIYQPGWRIMDYGDMKPIFFPRQRIK